MSAKGRYNTTLSLRFGQHPGCSRSFPSARRITESIFGVGVGLSGSGWFRNMPALLLWFGGGGASFNPLGNSLAENFTASAVSVKLPGSLLPHFSSWNRFGCGRVDKWIGCLFGGSAGGPLPLKIYHRSQASAETSTPIFHSLIVIINNIYEVFTVILPLHYIFWYW